MRLRWCYSPWLLCAVLCACQHEGKDLSAVQLSAVIDAARPALQKCYQDALDKSPRTNELRFQAVIHVEPSGEVSSLELDLKDSPTLSDCVGGIIGHLTFPKAEVATHASLPLIFRPEVVKEEPAESASP